MKLEFKTLKPSSLKNDIIKMIKEEELQTWKIHTASAQKYLKHIGQWGEKGVIKLTPDDINKILEVQVIKFKSIEGDVKDFEGYYLGRFCELIFVNFPSRITAIVIE